MSYRPESDNTASPCLIVDGASDTVVMIADCTDVGAVYQSTLILRKEHPAINVDVCACDIRRSIRRKVDYRIGTIIRIALAT